MNHEESQEVVAACAEKNVGAVAMKVKPGVITPETFDSQHPTAEQEKYIQMIMKRGKTRPQAIEHVGKWYGRQKENQVKSQPFIKQHGIKTEAELHRLSIQWAFQETRFNSYCISLPTFEAVDQLVPLSGTKLAAADRELLRDYRWAYGAQYCRHGCTDCAGACPHGVPVSTVQRYAAYFEQRRERAAMEKYAALDVDAAACAACDAPCLGACPHGVDIQHALARTHARLTLA